MICYFRIFDGFYWCVTIHKRRSQQWSSPMQDTDLFSLCNQIKLITFSIVSLSSGLYGCTNPSQTVLSASYKEWHVWRRSGFPVVLRKCSQLDHVGNLGVLATCPVTVIKHPDKRNLRKMEIIFYHILSIVYYDGSGKVTGTKTIKSHCIHNWNQEQWMHMLSDFLLFIEWRNQVHSHPRG